MWVMLPRWEWQNNLSLRYSREILVIHGWLKFTRLIVDVFPVAFAYILPVGLKIIGLLRKFEKVEVGSKNFDLMIWCK